MIWSATVSLPTGLDTNYLYIIQEGYRPILWEDFPNPRTVFPPKSKEYSINDGKFGCSDLSKEVALVKGIFIFQFPKKQTKEAHFVKIHRWLVGFWSSNSFTF